ncbi:Fe-Mn family superoxide dismutase [Actinoplanes teichomyceticus]|uniref:Fe-Mn family superoxide dismutase n=1 Tax=Actinoplanes teichomyceticus TaxID=1867 RepID=UPI001A558FC3|nr:Fe-Mn family superoxide dismutase [Actinoplanes teichomyceticus]GIF16666.1 hypothetical protein Ate01nite_66980 [Actinoplanes teichomyceticus]
MRADYVDRPWNRVNWADVIKRSDAARAAGPACDDWPSGRRCAVRPCPAGRRVIAAKPRGDLAGAEALLAGFPDDPARVRGFCLLAEPALSLVRARIGQSMDELVRELSLHMAATAMQPPPGAPAA